MHKCGPGSSVGIATDYGLHGPGIEFRWGREFPPVQTGPGAQPASCTTGTRPFPGVQCGRGVLLTTQPLLAPRSWKSRAIPLPPLGHNRACNGVNLPLLCVSEWHVCINANKIIILILCFLVRASSYIPISRPTDATCDRLLFSIYMCITLHVSSVKSFLQDSAEDRHKHRNWRLYVRWGTSDDEHLTTETCRVIHI
jgi:hypothetical protein